MGLGTPKNLEKNEENQKNKKKQSVIDLLQILLTGLFFVFLFGFPWFFGHMERWKWKKGKNMKKQKMQKPNAPSVPFWNLSMFWSFFLGRGFLGQRYLPPTRRGHVQCTCFGWFCAMLFIHSVAIDNYWCMFTKDSQWLCDALWTADALHNFSGAWLALECLKKWQMVWN